MTQRSETISPTAHYTGHIWTRYGMSHPAFATPQGRLFHAAVEPAMRLSAAFGGPTLAGFLLARHRLIDHRLRTAIESGRVSQVIEIAAGLSPRGWRFNQRFGDRLTYIEADLPDMAARKQRVLDNTGAGGSQHRVVTIDALATQGPNSLDGIAADLDPTQGLAIITEGLLSYLDPAAVDGLWARIATTLNGFEHGIYLSDLHLGEETAGPATRAFMSMLSAFVRGRVHLHHADATAALDALQAAGFSQATLHKPQDWTREIGDTPPGAHLVRVLEAGMT